MPLYLGHILSANGATWTWWLVALIVGTAVLVVEHHVVAEFALTRAGWRVAAIAVVGGLAVMGLPLVATTVQAQSSGALLPDLISDPPNPSFFNELNAADGSTRLVVTFDGYIHNIGPGPLDVVGNPQEPQGMKQRVRNNGEWEEVGAPTVRYETDDGHNHFHLIEVVEYVLWDELQRAQTAIGSKIGFCLVDSEVMEPGMDQSYSEELDNFCQEDNPSATSLRMGITPGWRDIYDFTTTLQWVDVSDVAPGRYWIGAITDPNNEILESNEDNNDLVFSTETISVPGFSPRDLTFEIDGQATDVQLTATPHGTVGHAVLTIEQGPSSGRVSVPTGVPFGETRIEYVPDAGFVGTDQIVYSVRDISSPYPFTAPTATVTFDVTAAGAPSGPLDGLAPPLVNAPSTFFESTVGERFEIEVEAVGGDGSAARLYASNLPAGLAANWLTGTIGGVPIEEGIFDVELSAVQEGIATSQTVTWIVNPAGSDGGLQDLADQSSAKGELTSLRLGAPSLGARYEAVGDLPPGLELDPVSPTVSGTPTEVGDWAIEIQQLSGDDFVASTTFIWTVRPSIDIAFPL